MERISINYTGGRVASEPPDGFVPIITVYFDGENNLQVGINTIVQLPVDERTISVVCECIRRSLSNTLHGSNA